jgi:hypothetical protein
MRRFYFELFIGFGNIIDVFVDRAYGPNFDPANEWARSFIDRVQSLDQIEIESGRVQTHTHGRKFDQRTGLAYEDVQAPLSRFLCAARTMVFTSVKHLVPQRHANTLSGSGKAASIIV